MIDNSDANKVFFIDVFSGSYSTYSKIKFDSIWRGFGSAIAS